MLEAGKQRAWVEVHPEWIAHNVEEIRRLMGNTKIMGVVKADAYGHGAELCAKKLEEAGVDYFAVACLEEGIALRKAGLDKPILVLGWTPEECFDKLAAWNLIQTAVSFEYACRLAAYGRRIGVNMPVHVKIDTGMNRTGILYQEGARHFEEIEAVYGLDGLQVLGLFSHFPVSDELEEEARAFYGASDGSF